MFNNGFDMVSVAIANIIGIMMVLLAFFGNTWRLKIRDKESKYLMKMMLLSVVFSAFDVASFACNGKPGEFAKVINYGGSLCSYILGFTLGPLLLELILYHLLGYIPRIQKLCLYCLCFFSAALLFLNFFKPIIFYINDENVYSRGPLWWILTIVDLIFLLDGVGLYFYVRINKISRKYFPIAQFVVPVAIGFLIQQFFYGVSMLGPCIAIAICEIFLSYQNESYFQDKLTGCYNRFYFEDLIKKYRFRTSVKVTAMMLDLNGFKQINDTYGHSEGDKALTLLGKVLMDVIGKNGTVIRYAGDEFVVLLNSVQKEVVEGFVSSLNRRLAEELENNSSEYEMSLAIGYCTVDLAKQSVDEIINETDRRMYEDKMSFYSNNKRTDAGNGHEVKNNA